MSGVRSSLAALAPLCREADDSLARAAAAKAWHEAGIVLINPDWLRSYLDQKQLELLAVKMFGERKA